MIPQFVLVIVLCFLFGLSVQNMINKEYNFKLHNYKHCKMVGFQHFISAPCYIVAIKLPPLGKTHHMVKTFL